MALEHASSMAQVKFASISAATNGNNTLVQAVTGKKIRVLSYVIIAGGTVNAKFQTGAGGTDLCGAMPLVAQAGVSSGLSSVGHFETAAGSLLNLSLDATIQVSGHLAYQEV